MGNSDKSEFENFDKLKPALDLFVKQNQMTNREKEILALLIQQRVTADELADDLGISRNTVRIHLRNINTKLSINSKSELLGRFIEFSVNNDPYTVGSKREHLKVLMTDDDESYVELMKKAAESTSFGVTVKTVLDAQSMLEYLHNAKVMKDGYEMPNFILLDLSMPEMNGFEALSILKGDPVLNKVPVIVFSSSEKEDVSNTYALGANSFVSKPNDFQELKALMGTLCHYWGQVEALAFS